MYQDTIFRDDTGESGSPRLIADGGMVSDEEEHWRALFPFGQPYENQEHGIKTAINTGANNGYSVVEGACGTGKTLMALVAGLTLCRDPDTDYERVVVATPLRQQMRAFEEDLKAINEHAASGETGPEPVTAVSLVGKKDVCPYSTGGSFSDGDVYTRCNPLRNSTREIVYDDSGDTGHGPDANPVANAMGLVNDAHEKTSDPTILDTAASPFADHPFEFDEQEYCPYYAQYLADDITDESSIPTDGRVLTRKRLMTDAVEYGTCPHTTMRDAMLDAEVVVGNYQHVFNPQIVDTFSGPLVNENTFLIVDEAHTLLRRVREELSDDTTHTTLVEAVDECRQVEQWLDSQNSKYQHRAQSILEQTDVSRDDIEELKAFLDGLASKVAQEARQQLNTAFPDRSPPYFDIDDVEVAFDDPQNATTDTLREWAREEGYNDSLWERGETIGEAIADIKSTIKREVENKTGEGTKFAEAAGGFLCDWASYDHTYYFRELRLVDRGLLNDEFTGWKATTRAELWLNNLIPASELASKLDSFGGGVLMSATLAPLDVFAQTAGLNYLTERPVETEIYELAFPEANRDSYAVELPPFTYDNRGDPSEAMSANGDATTGNRTRQQYLEALKDVITATPGNVMVYLPSYSEAEWATASLEDAVDKPVLCDVSSTNQETDALKEEFIDGEPKVLATSLRGTLTEGVDFSGDRLSAAVVVGVPILPFVDPLPKALLNAYQDEYGYQAGFDYAFGAPAVRKARQALGRVIRGTDDVGVRVFLDKRYTPAAGGNKEVRSLIPDAVAEEYTPITPDELSSKLTNFWANRG